MNLVWLVVPRVLAISGLMLVGCQCRFPPLDSTPETGESRLETGDSPPDSTPETGESGIETGDSDPPVEDARVALVADGGNERYVYIRLDTSELIYEIDLREEFPTLCADPWECVAFGAEPLVDSETGEDLAIIIAYVTSQGDSPADPGLAAQLRLSESGVQVDWQLYQLDWTTNFAGQTDICKQTTPCEALEPVGGEDWQDCTFRNAHAVEVVEETEDSVTMWIADTGTPPRALKVRLDKSSVCGVVEEVHGAATHDDWGDGAGDPSGPNDLDMITWDGREAMLLNHLTTAGSDTLGVATLWVRGDDEWDLVYQHPVAGGTVMGGHNSDMVTATDGETYHVFAHGNGAGANQIIGQWDPDLDHRGTISMLRIQDGLPVYLMDVTAPEPGFSFLRDADMLEDDSFLVTDSGCMNTSFEGCQRDAALWHVAFDFHEVQGQGLSGAFSEAHEGQNFEVATLVEDRWPGRLTCGLNTPYESDLILAEQLGTVLSAALVDPVSSCADQDEASSAR